MKLKNYSLIINISNVSACKSNEAVKERNEKKVKRQETNNYFRENHQANSSRQTNKKLV